MLKYILIGGGILFAGWLILFLRKLVAAINSGDVQRALEAKRVLRELPSNDANTKEFMDEYVNEHSSKASTPIDATPDKPEINARFSSWIAIKSDSPRDIVSILDSRDPEACNWQTASAIISSSMSNKCFAGSSIDGWVLVFGLLPEPDPESPQTGLWALLQTLSERFGSAQYYSCSTVADFYTWSIFENGKMKRAFSVGGNNVYWNHGDITNDEKNLAIKTPSGLIGEIDEHSAVENIYNAGNPLELAAAWSISPEDLYGRNDLEPSAGILFTLQSMDGKLANA